MIVTNAGGGYSRWKDLAVTRWREDTTCDDWGTFCYIRDVASGVFWSNTHQPTLKQAQSYQAMFSEGRAEIAAASRHEQLILSKLDATAADAQLYARLAASVIYTNGAMRALPGTIARNRQGQSGLWGYGISGDLPVVLLKIADPANIDTVRQLVQAHGYWRAHGLPVDLVVLNAKRDGCDALLPEQIAKSIAAGGGADRLDKPGGIFVRAADKIDDALIQLLDPPFDRSEPNPGYIKGYLRGVRENGGQYTHAAVWAAMAFAALGDAERAWKLFTMIDPVGHANSADSIAVYKTEPYVLASDVYALAPHTGRGGWTWYTVWPVKEGDSKCNSA